MPELLDAVCERIPAPVGDADAPLQALIFDSQFDQYRGVVSSVRVMNGRMTSGSRLKFMQTGALHEIIEIGARRPVPTPLPELGPGEVGYLIAGIKDVAEARSGETVTTATAGSTEALPGYRDPKPMVFCGLYPIDGDDFENLRESLQKLKLNDASVTYEPESSGALGFGFRCGFLGLLHMEIVKERLEREFNLALIATAPSVEYRVHKTNGDIELVDNPADLPMPQAIDYIEEPYFRVSIVTPKEYTGTLMDLCQTRRGDMIKLEYLSPERVELHYKMPLAEVVVDFFDQMKSRTQGYASLDYELSGYERSNLVKVDLLLNGIVADAFSTIVHRDKAFALRQPHVREAEGADPAADVRRADPGRDRRQGHRPRDGEGQAQGRAGQVLRRRHHPQAQAAREAEGGQEEDEVDRTGRSARRRLHLRPQARRLTALACPARRIGGADVERGVMAGSQMFRSLRHRNARLFFIGLLVSNVGTWMQLTAMSILVYRLTGKATDVGITLFCQFLPMLVLGVWAGAVADRVDKRRMAIITQTLLARAGAGCSACSSWPGW